MLFKKFLISDFLSVLMSGALVVFLYWYAYHYSLSQHMVAIVGIGQLFGVLLATVGGGLADSFNKVKLIKSIILIRVILIIVALVAFSMLKTTQVEFLLGFFMLGLTVCSNLLSPTLESLVPQLANGKEELYQFNSKVSILTQSSSIVAVFLSAVYIAFLSLGHVLVFSAFLGILSYLSIARLEIDGLSGQGSTLQNIKSGIVYIVSTSYIRNLIPIALVMNFCFWSVFLLLPKVSSEHFAFWKTSYSYFELSYSLGGILAGFYAAKRLYLIKNKFKVFIGMLLLQSIALIIMGISLRLLQGIPSYSLGLAFWGAYAFFNTILSIVYFSSVQLKTPENILGSVIGAILTIFSFTNPLAAVISPLLTSLLSPAILIISFGIVMLLMTIGTLFINIKDAFENEEEVI